MYNENEEIKRCLMMSFNEGDFESEFDGFLNFVGYVVKVEKSKWYKRVEFLML